MPKKKPHPGAKSNHWRSNTHPIRPDWIYDIHSAARHLGSTHRTLRARLLTSGEVPYFLMGRSYWVLGSDIIEYARRNRVIYTGGRMQKYQPDERGDASDDRARQTLPEPENDSE